MAWILGILLFISIGINIFQYKTIKLRTMNFGKQINILNARFMKIMERYEMMVLFMDGIVNNPRYAETYVKFDPIIQEIINKIRDFQTTLVNIFNVKLDEIEDNEDATVPQDLQQGERIHEESRNQ